MSSKLRYTFTLRNVRPFPDANYWTEVDAVTKYDSLLGGSNVWQKERERTKKKKLGVNIDRDVRDLDGRRHAKATEANNRRLTEDTLGRNNNNNKTSQLIVHHATDVDEKCNSRTGYKFVQL